ncbi:cytochrome C [Campylobacter sp. MIT 99-7217]|nr:cytochrome C [Campylobacter sp. MIT 99-7217]
MKNDRSSSYQQTSDDIAKLYAKECAFCHGKNGEKKALGASLIIKDMSKEEFANTLKGYQAGTYGKKLAKQMKPYADMLNAQQISQLATLIAKAD